MNTVSHKIEIFCSQFPSRVFDKNQILIEPEEKISSIFFLKKGLVRMYIISEDGLEATIHVFRPGSFFPIMLWLSNKLNKYYFEAIEEVETVKAPADKVLAFVKNDPEVLFDLTTRFADAINGLMNRIEQLVSQGAYSKIASLLLYYADTFGQKKGNMYFFELPFSHDQIGTWVGATRETVSRQMEILEKKRIITHKNHKIIINDLVRLRGEVSK